MDQPFTIKEYWNFLKSYKKVIFSTIILCILLFGSFFVLQKFFFDDTQNNLSTQEQANDEVIIDEEQAEEYLNADYDSLNETQQAELIQYLNHDAYMFRYYIEDENADPYTEFRAVKEIITTDSIVAEIENRTSLEFLPDAKRAIRLDYNGDNFIHTFLVGVGDEQANLELATEYFRLFEEQNIPFFDNKRVFLIDESPMKFQDKEDEETIPSEIEVEPQSTGTSAVLFILTIVIAMVLGVIVSFVHNYLKNSISYLYNYQLINNEKLVKLNKVKPNNEITIIDVLKHTVNSTKVEKLIVSNSDKTNEYAKEVATDSNYHVVSNILDISPTIDVQEIYIFTILNYTKKDWYIQQLQLARNYQVKLIVIETD
ncbi:hypothetical protein QNK01_10950 [Desemzia incerta]|uniref:hypothetical protein n=1 Tax=Desemzia incerta TaxID=82801 RepID=UPI0024C46304|nr:hypothetical protein [Desemzia incerta]WHZ31951.1 hypothetical protein QNK01_10950 [Desemzia incerta]